MAVNAELREQVEAEINKRPEVTPRNMMGTTSYMVRGRMFAFWVPEGLVVKLPDRTRQELLDRKAGAMFQGPQGRGFGEWTTLNLEKEDDLTSALEGMKSAYEYIKGGLAARPKARKKGKRR
jgi:TfoX/Sxy family transcriptional regulator of competence genes